MAHIILVNNTGSDIRLFENSIIESIRNGSELHEDIADLFTLNVIEVDGLVRGILNAA